MARLTVTAKPIKWDQTDDSFWADSEYGFSIMVEPYFDADSCFAVSWGDENIGAFATLEEAQSCCQEEINAWVKQIAVVHPQDEERPMTDMAVMKDYIGDSVYVGATIFGELEITTENGLPTDPSNRIILNPEVIAALERYIARMRSAGLLS